jgi:hypothetical protein
MSNFPSKRQHPFPVIVNFNFILSIDLVVYILEMYKKYLCDRMGKCILFLFLVDFWIHGIKYVTSETLSKSNRERAN